MAQADADQARLLQMVEEWLAFNVDNNTDMSNRIREPLQHIYPLFIFLHALVAVAGITGNITIIFIVAKRKLYSETTHLFIANLAVSDIVKALFVMPLTLTNLLMKHWFFGSFLCYFIPMLQSFPVYVSMLTYLSIAVDRYRYILYPMKARIPAGLTIIGTWIVSICIVLPQAIYLQYFDLGQLSPAFGGLGICLVSIEKNYEEYVRSMFVILYAMPLASIAFMYIKSNAELKALHRENVQFNTNVEVEPISSGPSEISYFSKMTYVSHGEDDRRPEPEGASTSSHFRDTRPTFTVNEGELDTVKEKRTQKYLMTMNFLFAACWCPLNILYLVTPFLVQDETEEHMDITFITFSWMGFLSTCTTPILFANWRLTSNQKARLRGYFDYKKRRSSHTSACHLPTSRENELSTPSRHADQIEFL